MENEKGAYDVAGLLRRKDLPEYEGNPSIPSVLRSIKSGSKVINGTGNDRAMIVSAAGEVLAPVGFSEIIEVDRGSFVKLYVNGIKALTDLSSAGTKVFTLLHKIMQSNRNTDVVTLHFKMSKLSRTVWEKGLTELLNKKILFKSVVPTQFFVNMDFMFNGDRLAILKEYRVKESLEPQLNLPENP